MDLNESISYNRILTILYTEEVPWPYMWINYCAPTRGNTKESLQVPQIPLYVRDLMRSHWDCVSTSVIRKYLELSKKQPQNNERNKIEKKKNQPKKMHNVSKKFIYVMIHFCSPNLRRLNLCSALFLKPDSIDPTMMLLKACPCSHE